MSTTIETRIRRQLGREAEIIEGIRLDPERLKPVYRRRHAEVVAELEAALTRTRIALDRLATVPEGNVGQAGREFESAWNDMSALLQRVER